MFRNQITATILSVALVLSGCVTTGGGTSGSQSTPEIGPQLSSLIEKVTRFGKEKYENSDPDRPKLDVIIPVFDPGIPNEVENDQPSISSEGGSVNPTPPKPGQVWPELRRAEAIRFAHKLKLALEDTEVFGAVRVTPDATATGDLYVLGRIDESNGEEVEIDIRVVDISGKEWMNDSFDHEVEERFHKNIRNKGKDPYDPIFDQAAKAIVEELSYQETAQLKTLERLTDLRFGASFIDTVFAPHMEENNGLFTLASYPADDDPMLVRTKAIRVRDQLFVDGLQDNYRLFSEKMSASYSIWQEQSMEEIAAQREVDQKAAGEAVAGVLLVGLAVLAAAASSRSNNYNNSAAAAGGAVIAGAAGAHFLGKSFRTSEESKVHRVALEELAESIDAELAPHVVAFEQQTIELSGNAKQQFSQWRAFLKKIYLQERTPEKQL
jgi:hypothetical protein